MSDFTDIVVDHVRRVTLDARRRHYRSWVVHVADLEEALDVPLSSLLTALRKAEERKLLVVHGDPPHSCQLGEVR
jgi:hypothetical protein